MSDRKKRYGVFFTPPELVNEMLAQLPQERFRDPDKTFCDPTCGNGNFLIEVVRRKIAGGSSPMQALATTYGVDILPDNVLVTRHRLLKEAGLIDDPAAQELVSKRIKLGDSLGDETWLDENFETVQIKRSSRRSRWTSSTRTCPTSLRWATSSFAGGCLKRKKRCCRAAGRKS